MNKIPPQQLNFDFNPKSCQSFQEKMFVLDMTQNKNHDLTLKNSTVILDFQQAKQRKISQFQAELNKKIIETVKHIGGTSNMK